MLATPRAIGDARAVTPSHRIALEVTAPAELFTETGLEIKRRSPLPRTLPVGYTNGSIGYVPIPEAYPEGGYEVTHACQVGPEAAGIITETAITLLKRLT